MFPRTRLIWASVFFGVFWTAGMVWWTDEGTGIAHVIPLSVAGAVAATAWYFSMRWFGERAARRQQGEP
jgi:hypothetical protein